MRFKQRTISILLASGLLFVGCQTIQFETPTSLSASDWPTDGKTQLRSRYLDSEISLPLEKAWEYSANAGFGPGSPLILEDQVLVATRKGEVHAIDLETGRGRGFKRMGDVIEGSPLIANGMLYVPTAWGEKVLIAYDLRRGLRKWRATGPPFETALLRHENSIVGIDVEGVIRAFDEADGTELWQLPLGERVTIQASPLMVSTDLAFVATDAGIGMLIDFAAKKIVWEVDLGAPVYSTPASADGEVFVSTTRGTLVALSLSDGEILWSLATENPKVRFGPPAVDAHRVYAGSTEGRVRAIDRISGEVSWEAQLEHVISSPPLVVGDKVFVGTMGKQLLSFNSSDGELVWKEELKGRVKSAMAVTDDGLIVLSEPKWVTYFKHAEASDEE